MSLLSKFWKFYPPPSLLVQGKLTFREFLEEGEIAKVYTANGNLLSKLIGPKAIKCELI